MCACVSEGRSIVSNSLWSYGLYSVRLFCLWNSLGKHIGVDSHSLFQGIFLTQGLNPDLLHYRQILYRVSHQGIPLNQIQILSQILIILTIMCSTHIAGRLFIIWATWESNIKQCYLLYKDICIYGLQGEPSGKEPGCQCRRHKRFGFNPWVRKIPWRRAQ